VPSRIWRVRAAAWAMNSSGDPMISKPPEWCSPIHASWIAEPVEVVDQLEVAVDLLGRALVVGMERRDEHAEALAGHAQILAVRALLAPGARGDGQDPHAERRER
jgi:hypothetical protein